MKKTLLIALGLLVCSTAAMAKKEKKTGGKQAPFTKDSKCLALGIGFGNDDFGYFSSVTNLPTFSVSYDQGIINNAGPGTVGLGGIVAYTGAYYNYSNGKKATWSNTIVGVRGTYHLTLLKDKNNKFDPYAGVLAGVRIAHYSDNYAGSLTETDAHPIFGAFVGAKYNFNKSMGVFAEAGYDISFLSVGINFNFGNMSLIHKEGGKKVDNSSKDSDKDDDDKDEKDSKAKKK